MLNPEKQGGNAGKNVIHFMDIDQGDCIVEELYESNIDDYRSTVALEFMIPRAHAGPLFVPSVAYG